MINFAIIIGEVTLLTPLTTDSTFSAVAWTAAATELTRLKNVMTMISKMIDNSNDTAKNTLKIMTKMYAGSDMYLSYSALFFCSITIIPPQASLRSVFC